MPIRSSWLVKNRVILVQCWDCIAVDDLKVVNEGCSTLLKNIPEGNHLIHLLVDVGRINQVQFDVKAILQVVGFLRHPRLGWLLFHGSVVPVLDFIIHAATSALRLRHRKFTHENEAIEFLREMDEQVAPLLPNVIEV